MDEKSQKQFTSKAYIAQEHIEVILNYKVSTYFFLMKLMKILKYILNLICISDKAFKSSGIFQQI